MAIVKSKLLKQLKKNNPNYLKKDLDKTLDIILEQIKNSLKKGESVELRGFGRFSTKLRSSRSGKNPKTGERIVIPSRRTISFKMAKESFNKINE